MIHSERQEFDTPVARAAVKTREGALFHIEGFNRRHGEWLPDSIGVHEGRGSKDRHDNVETVKSGFIKIVRPEKTFPFSFSDCGQCSDRLHGIDMR